MISRGFQQLEECSRFAAVMFLDREHFGLFDGDVVHNHASAASLSFVMHVCTYVQTDCQKYASKLSSSEHLSDASGGETQRESTDMTTIPSWLFCSFMYLLETLGGKQRGIQCFHQKFEMVGCRGVEFKTLVSNPGPILHEGRYCTINCCVLAYV